MITYFIELTFLYQPHFNRCRDRFSVKLGQYCPAEFYKDGLKAYDSETGNFKCTPYGTANLPNDTVDHLNERYCNKDSFFSEWSYGYRLRAALTYKDLLPTTVITPSLTFRHDVSGYSQNFQEGQMSLAAAVSANFRQKYSAEVIYQNFFGSNDFSTIDDRDFISLAFKYSF